MSDQKPTPSTSPLNSSPGAGSTDAAASDDKVEKGTLTSIQHPNDEKRVMNVDAKTAKHYIDNKGWEKTGTVRPKNGPGVVSGNKKN